MINDPSIVYGPAVSRLRGIHISLTRGRTTPLRRIDPKKIADLSYEDPETRHARIVFAIKDKTLIINRVFPTHQAYTTALGLDK
jgi:hypothetical protein